jgi:hypothetical protein
MNESPPGVELIAFGSRFHLPWKAERKMCKAARSQVAIIYPDEISAKNQ